MYVIHEKKDKQKRVFIGALTSKKKKKCFHRGRILIAHKLST